MKKSAKTFLAISVTILVLVLAILFCLLPTKKPPTWQEQYDLGIRYLSDGNYQEAIIAFTAAIEIDAMRPEAYLKAAEAYEAIGDSEAARAILEKGYAATGDESLRPKEEAPEETEQAWILDDFIAPQELTIGNIPFYLTDIYAASEICWDEHYEIALSSNEQLRYGNNPSFAQWPDRDVLKDVYYYYNSYDPSRYQPEFRWITMGMSTVEALKNLGFAEYGIQVILDFAENGIDYFDGGAIDYPIGYSTGNTHISANETDGVLNLNIHFRSDDGENWVSINLLSEDNVLESLSLHYWK